MATAKDPFTKQPLVSCQVELPANAGPCQATPPVTVNGIPYTYQYGKAVEWPDAAISAARNAGLTVTILD